MNIATLEHHIRRLIAREDTQPYNGSVVATLSLSRSGLLFESSSHYSIYSRVKLLLATTDMLQGHMYTLHHYERKQSVFKQLFP